MFYMFNNFNPKNKTEKHTLKEWELHTGIKILKVNDKETPKSKINTKLYTRRAFKRILQKSIITCKTDKGLEFLKTIYKEG